MSAEIGRVEHVSIEEEMRRSYLDYAMSVIVQRALPDVRDGLKPVSGASSMACMKWACAQQRSTARALASLVRY